MIVNGTACSRFPLTLTRLSRCDVPYRADAAIREAKSFTALAVRLLHFVLPHTPLLLLVPPVIGAPVDKGSANRAPSQTTRYELWI